MGNGNGNGNGKWEMGSGRGCVCGSKRIRLHAVLKISSKQWVAKVYEHEPVKSYQILLSEYLFFYDFQLTSKWKSDNQILIRLYY